MNKMLWLTLMAVSMSAACTIAIGGSDDTAPREFNFDAPYDAVWDAAIAAFADLELPISTLEKESGVIATDWILLDDAAELMDCDGNVRAEEGRFNAIVRGTAAGTRMTLTASYRAQDPDDGVALRCSSTGVMEERVRGRVDDLLD
ncbi:hypothetical protein BH20GEM1_BH20GEM1_03380 [soil metagenome]